MKKPRDCTINTRGVAIRNSVPDNYVILCTYIMDLFADYRM